MGGEKEKLLGGRPSLLRKLTCLCAGTPRGGPGRLEAYPEGLCIPCDDSHALIGSHFRCGFAQRSDTIKKVIVGSLDERQVCRGFFPVWSGRVLVRQATQETVQNCRVDCGRKRLGAPRVPAGGRKLGARAASLLNARRCCWKSLYGNRPDIKCGGEGKAVIV